VDVAYSFEPRLPDEFIDVLVRSTAYLSDLAVDEAFQRRGIGRV